MRNDWGITKKAAIGVLGVVLLTGTMCGCAKKTVSVSDKTLTKSEFTNPLIKEDADGNIVYGGDPSVMVDGDTVYLYTGHDVSTDTEVSDSIYNIPEYLCYSSTDLKNWTNEGVVMNMKDVSWASNDTSAWASQVIKHADPDTEKDMYYLYYCSWAKTGKQSIGVAVSDSPTGTFTDLGKPLVSGSVTKIATSTYNDIDPTVWIDTDENGEEHRYLAWGNGLFFCCELNEDMISVKDQNGDGKITCATSIEDGDIINNQKGLDSYTEAPWLYRSQDENGDYYGDYYLFFAYGWREGMGYATIDDPMTGSWSGSTMFMAPTATSNTNHEAIFDFDGKTYMIYHDGALPAGNGFRRSACIREITFEDDGSVTPCTETTASLFGNTVTIAANGGESISHESFTNSVADSDYPYVGLVVGTGLSDKEADNEWVLVDGKASGSGDVTSDSRDANGSYVSIESENKTGLYLTVSGDKIVLSQDTDASAETAASQTFISTTALNGDENGTSFMLLSSTDDAPRYISVSEDGSLVVTDGSDADSSTFTIS